MRSASIDLLDLVFLAGESVHPMKFPPEIMLKQRIFVGSVMKERSNVDVHIENWLKCNRSLRLSSLCRLEVDPPHAT